MEVTLRKAAALSAALLTEARKVQVGHTVAVSVYTEQPVANFIHSGRVQLKANLAKATEYFRVAYDIREGIAQANVKAGISALLAEKNLLDNEEKILSTIPTDKFVDSAVAAAQLQTAKTRATSTTPDPYEYRRESTDHLSVSVVDKELGEYVANRLAEIRKAKVSIADKLLEANMTTKVKLSPEIVEILTSLKLV